MVAVRVDDIAVLEGTDHLADRVGLPDVSRGICCPGLTTDAPMTMPAMSTKRHGRRRMRSDPKISASRRRVSGSGTTPALGFGIVETVVRRQNVIVLVEGVEEGRLPIGRSDDADGERHDRGVYPVPACPRAQPRPHRPTQTTFPRFGRRPGWGWGTPHSEGEGTGWTSTTHRRRPRADRGVTDGGDIAAFSRRLRPVCVAVAGSSLAASGQPQRPPDGVWRVTTGWLPPVFTRDLPLSRTEVVTAGGDMLNWTVGRMGG